MMPRLVLLLALACTPLMAASTSYWELSSFGEFSKGKLEGVSLSRDGRLVIAPRAEQVFTSDQPVIWNIAPGPQSSYFVATGHRGQVFRVDSAGKSQLYWTSPEPEVFALAADSRGVLYAGTSPDGKIYRIENGKASEYFAPKSKYIWSLALAADGSLYAGTGEEGKVFRITAAGQGAVWYETGQTHVTCLALDKEGRLLAGTEPNGILYRVTAKDKAFVLYDAGMPEIRAVAAGPDGSVYVAALGGSQGRKQAGAQAGVAAASTPVVATQPTTITVTDANAQGGIEIKPKPEAPKAAPPAQTATTTTTISPILDVSGVDKSALYRIHPDNLVETLWVSKDENIYDLVPMGPQILFSTDAQGRVYRLEADRKPTLLVETREGEATRLMPLATGVLAATSHAGRLFRIGSQPGDSGVYESPVHDAGSPSRWGRISWRADLAQGCKLAFRTRTGNSARPDKTWSDWSPPIDASGAPVPSPNARYLQWKAELAGAQGRTPELDSVTVAYLAQNNPPVVKSIQVTGQMIPATTAAKPAASSTTAAYSITITDTGDSTGGAAANPAQTVSRASSSQLAITWQAEDADSDKLVYSVFFRGEDERQWKLLKSNVTELAHTLDGEALADGRYLFRVVASDAPANPPASAREAELVSPPVLIDNTPPAVAAAVPKRSDGNVEIDVDANDAASPIRRLEYSIDAAPWIPVAPQDGVADSRSERFTMKLSVPAGEHLLVIRAYDAAGNAGLTKVILR